MNEISGIHKDKTNYERYFSKVADFGLIFLTWNGISRITKNSMSIGYNFFLYLFKKLNNFKFCSLFLLLLDLGSATLEDTGIHKHADIEPPPEE